MLKNNKILIIWIALTFFICHVYSQISFGGKPLERELQLPSEINGSPDYFVEMPQFDIDSVKAIDDLPGNRIGGLHFAHTFYKELKPETSGLNFHTANGTKVWKIGIRSKGAYSINLIFSEFNIPDGSKVFLYNTDRSVVLGAFTNKNNSDGGEFCVSPVEGDELIIEYQEPADADFSGKITIAEINHDYRGLFRAGTRFNQINLPCIPDISCDNKYDSISGSVCLLLINGSTYCTGVLVNNTNNDGKPYLLTASHCLKNNPALGQRTVVFLNYQSPNCNKKIRGSEEFSVSGSITRALSNDIDFALLELNEIPPADYRPYLAGWSIDSTFVNDNPYTCIHHPYGEVKKYASVNANPLKSDWVGMSDGIGKNNHWNIKKWDIGHTWTGSSGAPLFDGKMRLRGCLTGGDSGGSAGCSSYVSGDFFYRLDRAWDQYADSSKQLKHWLDPKSPAGVRNKISIDGLNPYQENPARRISNISIKDSLSVIYLNSPHSGSLTGQNSIGTSQYAEHFVLQDSTMINGIYLMVAKGSKNQLSPVTVKIFKGGETPGEVLKKVIIDPYYISYSGDSFSKVSKSNFSNSENYVKFDKPIPVGNDFFAGYEVSYSNTNQADSFYVYSAIRDKKAANTAFFKSNFLWFPFTAHYYKPVSTSLWIEPVVQKDTTTTDYNYTDPDTDAITIDKPWHAYSNQERMLYILVPEKWVNKSVLKIYDLSGRMVKTVKINSLMESVYFNPTAGSLFFLIFESDYGSYNTKFLIRH
jgi:V8-like Glu-specific endopeptidase